MRRESWAFAVMSYNTVHSTSCHTKECIDGMIVLYGESALK